MDDVAVHDEHERNGANREQEGEVIGEGGGRYRAEDEIAHHPSTDGGNLGQHRHADDIVVLVDSQ